jgi:hypothetical protein
MRFLLNRLLLVLLCLNTHIQAQEIRLLVQSSPLAGFQHHDAALVFSAIKPGDVLALVREPGNPHDVNAVRVEWQGTKLGYLPRRENRAVAMEMDKGGKIEARVARLRQHPNPRERLLIDIYAVL